MDLIESRVLPHTAAAPGLARRFLRSRAAAWHADLLDLVGVLASELVTNAVLHGREPVEIRVGDDGIRVRVEVSDGDPGPLPPVGSRPAVDQVAGRGLLIVAALADRWGCRRRRLLPGKTVWFELRHRAGG